MKHPAELDLVERHARLQAEGDRARLADHEAEIAAAEGGDDRRRVGVAVWDEAVDAGDERRHDRRHADAGPDEEAEERQAGHTGAGLLLEAGRVPLDDRWIGAHLDHQSAVPEADLRAFTDS